ncbi:SagB/ThcOx family dehydrogenase [Diaminobutyricibacter tongyongensis]|uniref:SagB/ThcOx family dehydrogenase n=1 Tax=Leifsonia tongyongensis TaxID=1268043 RepID=A0A6L9XTP5_9MICO|nr:SagB/ThcOx family dehydrogenase [Diaminobutyricibacter tongyongensis]NEN04454.1 SagB/ThcOx family dehydrogenase [Diaminobutyricibacter tongyongensis]
MFYDERSGWEIRNLEQRRSWAVDAPTAAVVIAFMQPSEPHDVRAALRPHGDHDVISSRILALTLLGVLSECDGPQNDPLSDWAAFGWAEAYDYLLSTWSYPFEDYSKRGQEVDKERMREYAAAWPDVVRALPQKGIDVRPLPGIQESLDRLSSPDDRGLVDRLLDIASVAALPIETMRSRTPGADYIHRTSPSGGSRHPSELYLLALSVEGLSRGVYHVATLEQTLGRVGALPPDDRDLRDGLPGAFRLPAPTRAIFVITSHFERNMYRYREPRTLRTLYYDAGHLGGLVEALGDSDGLVAHGHQGFVDSYLAGLIGSDGLAVESPSYLVSIGLAAEAESPEKRIGKSRLNS